MEEGYMSVTDDAANAISTARILLPTRGPAVIKVPLPSTTFMSPRSSIPHPTSVIGFHVLLFLFSPFHSFAHHSWMLQYTLTSQVLWCGPVPL